MLGGTAFGMLAFLNLKRAIARAYCSPRKTSSASFSRCASCRQTGIAIRSDARGHRVRDVGVFELEEGDRARVLLAAKDELGFLLALRLVPPDGHRDPI